MLEMIKNSRDREAYICCEDGTDEARVTSLHEYHREFGFAAPAMPRTPASEAPQAH